MNSHYEKYGKAWKQRNKEQCLEQRRIRRDERRHWLDNYRLTLKCSRCPENHVSCMEFHHIKNNKEFQIGLSSTRDIPIERIKAEIAKCIVLCSNCHKKLHWTQKKATEQ